MGLRVPAPPIAGAGADLRPLPTPFANANLPGEAFGAGTGAALMKLGQAAQDHYERASMARVLQAEADTADDLSKITSQYRTLAGQDAIGKGFNEVESAIEKAITARGKDLSPDQQQVYRLRVGERLRDARALVTAHADRQADQLEVDAFKAQVRVGLDAAQQNPASVQTQIERMRPVAAMYAARFGKDAAGVLDDFARDASEQAMKAALARGDSGAAGKLLTAFPGLGEYADDVAKVEAVVAGEAVARAIASQHARSEREPDLKAERAAFEKMTADLPLRAKDEAEKRWEDDFRERQRIHRDAGDERAEELMRLAENPKTGQMSLRRVPPQKLNDLRRGWPKTYAKVVGAVERDMREAAGEQRRDEEAAYNKARADVEDLKTSGELARWSPAKFAAEFRTQVARRHWAGLADQFHAYRERLKKGARVSESVVLEEAREPLGLDKGKISELPEKQRDKVVLLLDAVEGRAREYSEANKGAPPPRTEIREWVKDLLLKDDEGDFDFEKARPFEPEIEPARDARPRRTDPVTGETRVWDGTAWVQE